MNASIDRKITDRTPEKGMGVIAISDRADFAGACAARGARVPTAIPGLSRATRTSMSGLALGRLPRRKCDATENGRNAGSPLGFEIQMRPRQDRWRWSSRSLLELPPSRDSDQSTSVAAPIIGFGTVSSGPHLRPRHMCPDNALLVRTNPHGYPPCSVLSSAGWPIWRSLPPRVC